MPLPRRKGGEAGGGAGEAAGGGAGGDPCKFLGSALEPFLARGESQGAHCRHTHTNQLRADPLYRTSSLSATEKDGAGGGGGADGGGDRKTPLG
eukprot:7421010-Pyramimonas_sp.AAC.1